MQPKNTPAGGQWAEQQKIADEKQKQRPKGTPQTNQSNDQDSQQGGAGEPQTTPLEPQKQGGIGGP